MRFRQSAAAQRLAMVSGGVLVLASLVGCGPTGPAAEQAETVTVGVVGNTKDAVQPYSPQNSVSGQVVLHQIFEGLTRFAADGTLEYVLAESMEPNATADTWTIHVRPGVRLHNGNEFIAADVVASLEYMLDEANAYPPATQLDFLQLDQIRVVDDHTLAVSLKEPYGPFPDVLASERFVMRSVRDASAADPVGTGPFTLDSFVAGQEARLSRFSEYWGQQPGFEKLVVQYFPEQPAVINAIRGKQIDIAYSVPSTDARNLEQEDGIEVLVSDTSNYVMLAMNATVPPFDDPRVTAAMRLVIDREQIKENAYGGYASLANDYVATNSECRGPDLPQRSQNLILAKQLLAQSGHEGFAVELVTDGALPGMVETAQLFAQQAAEAGIQVTVRKVDVPTLLSKWREWPFVITYTSSPYLLEVTQLFVPGGEENTTHFDDVEYNRSLARLLAAASPAEQCVHAMALQTIEYDRGGAIIPITTQVVTAYRDTVSGLEPDVFGRSGMQLNGVTKAALAK